MKSIGLQPDAMFDRDNDAELATGQLGFINFMGMENFQVLAQAFP
eukprot:gene2450-3219_t